MLCAANRFNPRCGFFAVRTPASALERLRLSMFQSAMRIFCCSNPRKRTLDLLYQKFQSAMRIFCCSNARVVFSRIHSRSRFNPRCGFFAVRTVEIAQELARVRENMFQSAMRIFCCSNDSIRAHVGRLVAVSIRDADFLLFERALELIPSHRNILFQSAMRIFCCSNLVRCDGVGRKLVVSIRDADFLLFELFEYEAEDVTSTVSIRDADFLLFERIANFSAETKTWVSIRDADFLLFEQPIVKTDNRLYSCFNPRCGFFAVRTDFVGRDELNLELFQSAMRIFCCSNSWKDQDTERK